MSLGKLSDWINVVGREVASKLADLVLEPCFATSEMCGFEKSFTCHGLSFHVRKRGNGQRWMIFRGLPSNKIVLGREIRHSRWIMEDR